MPIYIAREGPLDLPDVIDATWDLIWQEEFNGPDGSPPSADFVWTFFSAFKDRATVPQPWGPWRSMYYDEDHAKVDGNGVLEISCDVDSEGRPVGSYIYNYFDLSSAPITSGRRFEPNIDGGDLYFEWSVDLSQFQCDGAWCAMWLYQGNGTNEIDVMEYKKWFSVALNNGSTDGNSYVVNIHDADSEIVSTGSNVNAGDYGVDLLDGNFHTFGCRYTQDYKLYFYLDGNEVWKQEDSAFVPKGEPLGIQITIEYDEPHGEADIDLWGDPNRIEDSPALLPGIIRVDYVRVYRKRPINTGVPRILYDGDTVGDIDNVFAIAVLNRLENAGECTVLCMGDAAWHYAGVGSMSVINDFYGNSHIPIGHQSVGVNGYDTVTDQGFGRYLVENFTYTQRSDEVDDCVTIYRQVLASQANGSVTVITNGPLNNIKDLLESTADAFSTSSGLELWARKVQQMHIMGGMYPNSSDLFGVGNAEFNFGGGGLGTDITKTVLDYLHSTPSSGLIVDTQITFNGFEVGISDHFPLGSTLNEEPDSNPVAAAFRHWSSSTAPSDTNSWDTIGVYTEIRGSTTHFTVIDTGFNDVSTSGSNIWSTAEDWNHRYLVEKTTGPTFMGTFVSPLLIPSFASTSTGGASTSTSTGGPGPTQDWDNQFTPPNADGTWVVRTVSNTNALTSNVGSHQTEYPPLGGGTEPVYSIDDYPTDAELMLVGDGTIMDMPIRLPRRVKRLHVRGINFNLDYDLGYDTDKNDSSGVYRIARQKTPFHVTFTHSLTIEGCRVHCNGLAIDIVQLPLATSDQNDHDTRDVYILNSAFFHYSGVGPGFHGDFFHSADNSCRRVYIENVYCAGSYNDITAYPIGGVNAVRQFNFRNTVFVKGPVYQGSVSSNFRLGTMEETPTFQNTWHPWGSWVITDGGGGQTDSQLFDSDDSGVPSQGDIAPDVQIGQNYEAPDWWGDAPQTRTANNDHAGLLFYPHAWDDDILSQADLAYSWRQTQHDPGNVSDMSLVRDNTFGLLPNGNTVPVCAVHMEAQQVGGVIDVASGNRGELNRTQDANGNIMVFRPNDEVYICLSIKVDSNFWSNPTPWFYFNQMHGTPTGVGSTFGLQVNASGELEWEAQGGDNGSSVTTWTIRSGEFTKNQWLHHIVYAKFSNVNGNAITQIWRRWETIDTDWVQVVNSTVPNIPTNGVRDFKMGVYRRGEVSDNPMPNPIETRHRTILTLGTSFDSVVPLKEWL